MSTPPPSQPHGDRLVWILGGVVAVVAVAALAFLYTGTPDTAPPPAALTSSPAEVPTAPNAAAATDAAGSGEAAPSTDFSIRLNRARLAMDARMLIEPEGYSAWSIYAGILDEDASNTAAQDGLALVAAQLIDQAFTALNAGQRDAAAGLAERVLGRFPDHAEAAEILDRSRRSLVAQTRSPDTAPTLPQNPQQRREPEPEERTATVSEAEPEPEPEPEPAPVDPVVAIYSDFTRALAEGDLRDSTADSAAAWLAAMRAADAEHAMTLDAESQLFDALLARHDEAFERLDADAALAWLDSADALSVDAQRVSAARDQIFDFVAAESATEPLAAAELTVRSYVPPEYPPTALRRGLEGWVDVAFVVSQEGKTMSVEATDESNSLFRNAATRAVARWEFEPHTVYERVVEQHAHTRIRFVLEE